MLGVAPTATADEIRAAYRRLARRHHPDRASNDAATMAALNEAYRVLHNPALRATHDAELARGQRPRPASPAARPTAAPHAGYAPPPRSDDGPARFPWRFVLAIAAVGATIVFAGAALFEPDSSPRQHDNVLRPGSCVAIEANGDAREVTCTGATGELVVEEVVPFGETCAPEVDPHRDRQGMGIACVTRRTD